MRISKMNRRVSLLKYYTIPVRSIFHQIFFIKFFSSKKIVKGIQIAVMSLLRHTLPETWCVFAACTAFAMQQCKLTAGVFACAGAVCENSWHASGRDRETHQEAEGVRRRGACARTVHSPVERTVLTACVCSCTGIPCTAQVAHVEAESRAAR